MSTISLKSEVFKTKSIIATLAIVSAIVLPQLFHVIGVISGTGVALGVAFLPMHIPVLLAGFLGGSSVGLIVGIVSPLISLMISGMPTIVILPFIVIELAIYGLMSGLLSSVKISIFVKLLIVQVVGRAVRALAVIVAIYGFRNQTIDISSIGDMVTASLPGIILQWMLIPLLLYRMKGLKKHYE